MPAREFETLPDLVRDSAEQFGNAVALTHVNGSRRLTFRQLCEGMTAGAGRLLSVGLDRGEPVLLLCEGRPEWAVGLFSILHAGLVAVPLPAEAPPAMIAAVVVHTNCRRALCSARTRNALAEIERLGLIDVEQLCSPADSHGGGTESKLEDLALLVYTSGSTQQPKAVELTHRNLLSNLCALLRTRPEPPGKTMLSLLPPAHLFEMMAGLLAPLARGAKVVYAGALLPNRIIDALRDHQITHALAVPALVDCLYREMLGQLGEAGIIAPERETQTAAETLARVREILTSAELLQLRHNIRRPIGETFETLVVGGAAIDPALAELIAALGIHVEVGYGLTEASPIVAVGQVGDCPSGSVGRPLPGVDVRVAATGEILVRGPNVMRGYYQDVAATRAALEDGWLHTGDCGRLDANGFLFVTGRLKEAIVTPAGRTVYPEEIEPYYRHPLFAELCAAGVPGDHGNDVPALFVVPASKNTTDEELHQAFLQLRQRAPTVYRLERLVRVKDHLPTTASGKIRRRSLAAEYGAR